MIASAGNGLLVHARAGVSSPPLAGTKAHNSVKGTERNRQHLEGRVLTPVMIRVPFLLSVHFANR